MKLHRLIRIACGLALASAWGGCQRSATRDRPGPVSDAQQAGRGNDASGGGESPSQGREQPRAKLAVPGPPIALRWSADGSRLAVDGRYSLDARGGVYVPIPCPSPRGRELSDCAGRVLSFSADGSAVVSVDGARLSVEAIGVGPRLETEIPRWLAPGKAAADAINVAFWLSPRTLFVQQSDRRGEAPAACRLGELPAGVSTRGQVVRWRAPAGKCFDADFALLTGAEPGPDKLIVLHSEGEGASSLEVVRYDPQRGQSPTDTPVLRVSGSGVASVSFERDGAGIFVITPCALAETADGGSPACDDPFSAPSWRLYRRPVGRGRTELRRADLPPGTVRHPTQDRFAWPDAGAICVGDPRDRGASRCYPRPN